MARSGSTAPASCFPSSTNAKSARVHVLEVKSRAEHRHREQEAGTTRLQAHKTFFSDNGAGIASTTGQSPGRQRPRLLRVPGHDRNKINVPKGGSTNEKLRSGRHCLARCESKSLYW